MSQKWKQQTFMFLFAMIMTRTVFSMKIPADQTDENDAVLFSNQELEDGPAKTQVKYPDRKEKLLVKKVKNAKHFAHFLDGADLLKYTLLDTRHKNFMECIPVTLKEGSGYVAWNMNAETVERINLPPRIQHFETERLKFVKDVFSMIPDTDSPTDYDFSFDTTLNYKQWFMLALHKQKNATIGRQWKYVSTNNFQTSNFEPCDVQWRWNTKNQIEQLVHWIKVPEMYDESLILTDGMCKALLAKGFHFPPDNTNKNQNICEYDIQCALKKKLDKSAEFLLLSYNDARKSRVNFHYNNKDLSIFDDIDVINAFQDNLCVSFTFMMNSKRWPKKLWKYVLESKQEQSNEMLKLLLDRIKNSPKANHLDDLLKFDALMRLADHESTYGHLNDCLKIFCRSVRTQVYQRLLFFGVIKADLGQCKFGVKNGASLQARTTSGDAIAIANTFCRCEKKEHPRLGYCLHTWLRNLYDMKALEIATNLARDGLHGGRFKDHFNKIADELLKMEYLHYEKNKVKSNVEYDLTLETELEDDSKNTKRKRQDKK